MCTPMTRHRHRFEIVVVGAGPAGLAAGSVAAESGKTVAILDSSASVGGQIWRGEEREPSQPVAGHWIGRAKASGARIFTSATLFATSPAGSVLAESEGGLLELSWERLVIATGARELFLPFPGWTLPGVVGPGGLHAMAKEGWPVAQKRIVVAGTGPLLLAVADGLVRQGAVVTLVAEQAPWHKLVNFAAGLWRYPRKWIQGAAIKTRLLDVPFRAGCWPVKAEGKERVESVTLTDGVRRWTEPCDYLACGFHLTPNLELPILLGCALVRGRVEADEWQETTVKNVFCAGEPTGIGGVDCALVEGQIAGFASAGIQARARTLFRRRTAWHRFRAALNNAFALRPDLNRLAEANTVVCRCEDIRFGELSVHTNWREAKLQTRCGMGACQGRICGAATRRLFGWETGTVRPPILPVGTAALTLADDGSRPDPNGDSI
jgi:NADPH-dependent 2,4-dienoyl-CoA reductase/sulfur reductase-like enzyme